MVQREGEDARQTQQQQEEEQEQGGGVLDQAEKQQEQEGEEKPPELQEGGQEQQTEQPLWKLYLACYVCLFLVILAITVHWHDTCVW
jgi:hypothetical protein